MSPKVFLLSGTPPAPKNINEPAQTEGGIDADADEVFACAFDVQTQDIAAETDHVAQVVKKLDTLSADGFRRNFAVAARGRGENVAVGLVVEFGNGAVVAFIRVGGAGFCKCRGGSEPDQQEDGVGGFFMISASL